MRKVFFEGYFNPSVPAGHLPDLPLLQGEVLRRSGGVGGGFNGLLRIRLPRFARNDGEGRFSRVTARYLLFYMRKPLRHFVPPPLTSGGFGSVIASKAKQSQTYAKRNRLLRHFIPRNDGRKKGSLVMTGKIFADDGGRYLLLYLKTPPALRATSPYQRRLWEHRPPST